MSHPQHRQPRPPVWVRMGACAVAAAVLASLGVGVAQAVDTTANTLTVTMERVDKAGENVAVGTKLRYKFSYKNTGSSPITVFPKMSNLTNTDTQSTANCRIGSLAASATAECNNESRNLATHVVTAEDVIAGTFTPETLFQATKDNNGTNVIQDNIVVTGDPVTIKTPTPDEASTAKDRKDGESVYLAKAKQFGTESYRIPAIAKAPNGDLLAAWDLRPVGGDAPNPNSIVQRISKDGGKSWSELKYVAHGRNASFKYGYSDPSYVVDEETGDVFLFFVKSYDQGFLGSKVGTNDQRDILQAVYVKSTDNGQTWSEPVNITKDVTKGHETEWKSRFATSGAGIQLKNNTEHKGRLIQQYAVKPTTGSIKIGRAHV